MGRVGGDRPRMGRSTGRSEEEEAAAGSRGRQRVHRGHVWVRRGRGWVHKGRGWVPKGLRAAGATRSRNRSTGGQFNSIFPT